MKNKPLDYKLMELSATYTQDIDSNSEEPICHELIVTAEDAGGGMYYTISTRRWAFDDISELIELLTIFEGMVRARLKE